MDVKEEVVIICDLFTKKADMGEVRFHKDNQYNLLGSGNMVAALEKDV
jgi:hypothetical protein